MPLHNVNLINDFSGGVSGTQVTAANSGGSSGAPFDFSFLSNVSGAILNYDTSTAPDSQTTSCQVATATAAAQAYLAWNSSVTTPNTAQLAQAWFRMYLFFSANPPATTTIFYATAPSNVCGTVVINTNGTVSFLDATGTAQITTAVGTPIPINSWFRLEGFIIGDPSVGQLSLTLYYNQDSTIPSIGPTTTTANKNTFGTMSGWRFGQPLAAANIGPWWMANIGISNVGYLGPTPLGFSGVRQDDGGAITQVAVNPFLAAPGGGSSQGSGVPGPVGCTSAANVYPNTTTRVQSAQAFDTIVGVPMSQTAQKLYAGATATAPSNDLLQLALGPHKSTFYLCVLPPAVAPIAQSAVTALQTSLQKWLNAGVPASQLRVILYQETQDQVTAQQYHDALLAYGPMIHGASVAGVSLSAPLKNIYNAAGHANSGWLSYYPSDSAANYIDEIGVDLYGDVFVNLYNPNVAGVGPGTIDPAGNLEALADSHNKPFGFPELGDAIATSNAVGINHANFVIYINYIQNKMVNRIAAGKSNSITAWYTSDQNSPVQNAIGGPNITVGAGSAGGSIKNIANSTWTSTTAGALAPGTLVCSGNIANAGFGIGGRAGTVWVQCTDNTVARINYGGIGGLGGNPAAATTFTGCVYIDSWTGWTSPSNPGHGNTTIAAGALIAVWPFDSGATTDFRIPYMQSLFNTASAAVTSVPSLVAGGDVEGLFVSEDQGLHWQASNTGVYGHSFRRNATTQFATGGEGTGVVYSCTGLNGGGGGFLASTNGGSTWAMRSTQVQFSGNTSNYASAYATDQARPTGNVLAQVIPAQLPVGVNDLMYCVCYSTGVFQSKGLTGSPNYGNSWTNIGLGTLPAGTGPSGASNAYGRCIAVDPANPAHVYVGMFDAGIFVTSNAATGSPATWTQQSTAPKFPEEMVICSSGNVYLVAGTQGLWTTPTTGTGAGTWTNLTGGLSTSSYWMSIDGYTDANGYDQLVLGCNSPVKNTGDTAYRTLAWCTVSPAGTPVFTQISNVSSAINKATIPPENRTWWHSDTAVTNPSQSTGYAEWLGGAGYFQPHVTIDRTTISGTNITLYLAGAAGVFISTGNTVLSSTTGPTIYNTAGGSGVAPQWTLNINGMTAYIGHQVVIDGGNQNHLAWGSRDWGAVEIFDGVAYDASQLTQWTPPRSFGGTVLGGFAMAIDPVTGISFCATGAKAVGNTDGQIWTRDQSFNIANVSVVTSGNPPWTPGYIANGSSTSSPTANPGSNVAYGLFAGRDGSNNPFLLAMIQGSSSSGGMYRMSGYSITVGGTNPGRISGSAAWTRVNSSIGTSGGASNQPSGPQGPIIQDPNNPSILYAFDQNTGIWRGSSYGQSWIQLWNIVCNEARSGFIACNPVVSGELWVSYWQSAANLGLYKIPSANTVAPNGTITSPPAGTTQITGGAGSAIPLPGGICFSQAGDVYVISLPGAAPLSPNTQLFGSSNGGGTWTPADNGSLAATASYPSNMVMTPAGRVYVANDANTVAYGYPALPAVTPSAFLQITPYFANLQGQDIGSGTDIGVANLSITPYMTVFPHGASHLAFANMAIMPYLQGQVGASALILQTVQGNSTFDYGISTAEISTSQGSTLIVLAGWDLSTQPTGAGMPAVYVTDSAGNYWYHVATTDAGNSGSRCTAWICPNATPVEWISVSLTTFASSLAYLIIELAGMPAFYSLDVIDLASSFTANSLALAPGTTTDQDFAFALVSVGGFVQAPTGTSAWNALSSVTSNFGPTDPNPVTIYPYFQVPVTGINLNTTFHFSQSLSVSGIIFAVHNSVGPPLQANPNFPTLKIEAAFGFEPGDVTQAPPTWTEITSRCMGDAGGAYITVMMGRQYELSVAEAGEITIALDNHDGAFTPGNVNSPYYPNIVLGTPIRVSAYWNGSWFYIAFGYVERWPQEWPDLPQWGFSKMVATDAFAALAGVAMSDAADAEMLLDIPYVQIPAAEQYTTFSNGINAFFNSADAQGLLAQNISPVNKRPGVYVDGIIIGQGLNGGNGVISAVTGATTNMLGTSNTGMGTDLSAFATPFTAPATGPGINYTDVNLPDPISGNGVSVSFWVIIAATVLSASLQPVVFRAFGVPSNYISRGSSFTIQINNLQGSNTLSVTLADGTSVNATFNVSPNPQLITVTLNAFAINIYINGALANTASVTAAQVGQWNGVSLGSPNYAYQAGSANAGNFTAFALAIYPYVLPVQRIVSQFNTGLFGQQNVDATVRMAQLLAWGNLGIPRAGRQTFNGIQNGVVQGPAYNLQGANVSDALNQVALNESAMIAAMPSGSLVFFHKWALFNQEPVVTFGDNPDITQDELPSLQTTAWGYDNTYVYNIVQVTQQYGANNQLSVFSYDLDSQDQYFIRSALTETIMTMNNLDVYDLANWQINKYSQPAFRLSSLTIDAASNPQAAFSVVLGIQQGETATVIRRPLGGAVIEQQVLVQQVTHAIGPSYWQTTLQMSPYEPEDAILQLDATGFNVLGNNALP